MNLETACTDHKILCLQVILAEDNEIRDKLAEHDLHVQTIDEVAPIEVSFIEEK